MTVRSRGAGSWRLGVPLQTAPYQPTLTASWSKALAHATSSARPKPATCGGPGAR